MIGRQKYRYGRARAACVLAVVLLAAGCSGGAESAPPTVPAAQQPAQGGGDAQGAQGARETQGQATGQDAPAPPGEDSGRKPARAPELPKSPPRSISIPSIQVSSTLEELGQQKDGTMETPRDPDKAGWYVPGPLPGAEGPAVIAGHVSWDGKPSVFHRLSSLKPGDKIEVAREDGKTAEFTVERIGQYAKNRFPTVEVYKNIDHAGLRLITCGGEYDASERYYSDNVVVFAGLTGSR
ncbi:class F sortase [Streptomyces sp. TRM49041]|uniref:class F sortase n=1 Tax=Streptomyces sp. TRM49041 TaxID=2603216 RepID=UPI0021CC614C|nr:class F sortase [Streptomyces sp. TRM49041]